MKSKNARTAVVAVVIAVSVLIMVFWCGINIFAPWTWAAAMAG